MSKVFGIGFHKTGTTTLSTALSCLGYKVCGHRTNLAGDLFKGDLLKAWKLVEEFDAFQDNPWPLLYKELDQRYPGSKFILTLRDEEKWIHSIVNHFGNSHTEMRRWIYTQGDPLGNEQLYLERYRQHNQDVLDYFAGRPEDLLVVSWKEGDGWEQICPFLNREIPRVPFPHTNKGAYTPFQKVVKTLKAAVRNMRK